jgi:hypothetical protein
MQYFIVKRHGNISMEIILAPNENSGKISMHQEQAIEIFPCIR